MRPRWTACVHAMAAAACLLASDARGVLPSTPTLQWRYGLVDHDPLHSISDTIPVVAQLTDDDGNGRVDGADRPDVAFLACQSGGSVLANIIGVDGATGIENYRVDGDFGDPWPASGKAGSLATADVDGDGASELLMHVGPSVLVFGPGGVLEREVAWPTHLMRMSGHALGLADMDQDGTPEMHTLSMVQSLGAGPSWTGTAGGRRGGYNSFSIAAEVLPGEPGLELFAGRTLYAFDGRVVWDATSMVEGPAAAADFDGDGTAEIVVVAGDRTLHLLDGRDGGALVTPQAFAGSVVFKTSLPVIADVDGDGALDVVLQANTVLVALRPDLVSRSWRTLWSVPIDDGSGAATPSTFDFDGDGAAEIVGRDENEWYIVDGRCGEFLFRQPSPGTTGNEQPVIANIDDDPHAEIVTNPFPPGVSPSTAIEAWEVFGSCTPRAQRNQATYHVTNVDDDGRVARTQASPSRGDTAWLGQVHAVPVHAWFDFVTAELVLDNCAPAVRIGWSADGVPLPSGVTVDVIELPAGDACCARADGTPLATGIASSPLLVAAPPPGEARRYLVAGTVDGATCAGLSYCTGPVTHDAAALDPAPSAATLRAAKVATDVELSWATARDLLPGETYLPLMSDSGPTGPFLDLVAGGTSSRSVRRPLVGSALEFFVVVVSDACSNRSES